MRTSTLSSFDAALIGFLATHDAGTAQSARYDELANLPPSGESARQAIFCRPALLRANRSCHRQKLEAWRLRESELTAKLRRISMQTNRKRSLIAAAALLGTLAFGAVPADAQ